jgi:hypothetical protein
VDTKSWNLCAVDTDAQHPISEGNQVARYHSVDGNSRLVVPKAYTNIEKRGYQTGALLRVV